MLRILLNFLAISTVAAQVAEYEYVIIGSGPGGGPLSANLARAGHSVFLIEAGEDHGDSLLQRIPSFADPSSEDPNMSWEFYVSHYTNSTQAYRDTKYTWRTPNQTLYVGTEPPRDSEPLGILYPRTGTLGGCGNHNAMNLALPPDNDWNRIANLTGDNSWNAETMRYYFQRLEYNNYIARSANGTAAAAGHGFDGWLHSNQNQISLLEGQAGLLDHIRRLFIAIGEHSPNSTAEIFRLLQRDMNRLDPRRYERDDLYQLTLHTDALRQRSSAQTYLRDTVNERNEDGSQRYPLTISTSSLATRVLFSNSTGNEKPRSTGVAYLHGQALYRADRRYNGIQTGTPMNVTATREVIVAGGAFNTPQILKLSGVGPREELESFNIPVVVDLPAVGTNLQDNYEAGVHVEAAQDFQSTFENCTFLTPGDPCLREWMEEHSGAYGQGAAPVGMLRRSSVSENADADLFYFGAAGAVFEGHYPGFSSHRYPPSSFFWSAVKMQTQNRAGTVRLRSTDPQDVPDISFNFFQEGAEHDLQALSEGVQFVLDVFNQTQPPWGPYRVINPNPEVELRQAIMDQAFSHHASSSCPMGPTNSSSSCVDSRFKVIGIDGLRVVDASVFPRVPGAFPILPTFMISEKATDVIMEDASPN
ncbi:alcohol oxidase [Lojkania enalia]|uniref:Alcohol oxidase n=1 Tax=Lojkania enalia TaxID=147567 RepID=A0A9P4N9U7_9PLEO|nr:alcohol oxidase [Didymosphaeria enalia]